MNESNQTTKITMPARNFIKPPWQPQKEEEEQTTPDDIVVNSISLCIQIPPGVDDANDDDDDDDDDDNDDNDDDAAMEVQTTFIPSQNLTMIVKFTIIIFHPRLFL